MNRGLFLSLAVALVLVFSVPVMADQVPPEILSALSPPVDITFGGGEVYVVSLETDPTIVADMLPDVLTPAGPGNIVNLYMYRFYLEFSDSEQPEINGDSDYHELVVGIPATYTSADGTEYQEEYLAQLYLGSIQPESSVWPTLAGQIGSGYPKREGVFDVKRWGTRKTKIKVERWSSTILDMSLKIGSELDPLDLPIDLKDMTGSFLFKAIPSYDTVGFDILQLNGAVLEFGETVGAWAVDATIKGDLVLDTGRNIPINSVLFSYYAQVEGFGGYSSPIVYHDFLSPVSE